MPELPEVETVCRGLATHILGKTITQARVNNRGLRQPLSPDFAGSLKGLKIESVKRRAKYILMHCDRNTTLIIHLGMSGSIVIHATPPRSYKKHDHVVLCLSDGSELVYHDPRRFGLMLLCKTNALESHKLFSHLGPEPLSDEWTTERFYHLLQTKRAPIKSVIMDQQVVVGVGNIYACEALFQSGIHPSRPANCITKTEAKKLHKAIVAVLTAAIESGGSTLRDYVRSSGDAGYFQHHFRVYDRKGEPCESCGSPVESMRQAGRSSFFCSRCQK
jgi:formamidopyrimidine-DNA glycosylase